MYDYIKKLIDSLLEGMKWSKYTAAPEYYLFRTDDEDAMKLSKEISDRFHKITAQILWVLGKLGGPNIQLGTTFLCTRARASDQHDYKKLQHRMMYLQATSSLPLILKADGNGMSL